MCAPIVCSATFTFINCLNTSLFRSRLSIKFTFTTAFKCSSLSITTSFTITASFITTSFITTSFITASFIYTSIVSSSSWWSIIMIAVIAVLFRYVIIIACLVVRRISIVLLCRLWFIGVISVASIIALFTIFAILFIIWWCRIPIKCLAVLRFFC